MSGKNRYVTDPSVINVYGLLMAELSALKAQFGLSELSIVVRDGRYFLEADGRLIEITFINGNFISSDVWSNLHSLLGQLLEQNGFSEANQIVEQDETVSLFGVEVNRNALEFAGFLAAAGIGKMFVAMGHNSRSLSLNSAYGPVVEGTTIDDNANTVTLDFDRELDTAKLPSTDDFEILVNGQKADISGIRIDSDKVELELARDLQPSDQVTVRYLDQTGDLENSIQGVDGSLAGSFYQGLVIDGYIAEAQLYIDKNGDGVPDPDEILEGVTTDERGVFLLDGTLNPDNLPILVTGGTNTDTGLPNNTILSAPAGATVITPTTTLIQKMIREGLVSGADDAAKVKAAQSIIKKALGLAEDIDLLSFDPIAAIQNQSNGTAGGILHKFNASVVEILESFGKGTSGNVAKAASEIAKQIVQAATESRELEIDASFTDAIVDKVFTSGDNVALKANMGVVVEAIQAATTLDAIATAQKGIAVQIKSEPITNDQTPIVFGTATVGATVTATIAGATYEVVAGPDGKWLVDTSTATPIVGSGALQIVPNGSNDVSVSAKDPSGNTSTAVSQILAIDTTPPTIDSASFDFGTVLNITKAAATGTLTVDTTGVEDGQSVTLTLGTKTFLGTVNNNIAKVTVPSGSLQSLQEGVVTYKVDVSDAAGNAATQYTDSFSYDGTPPTLAITMPIEGDNIVNAAEDADVSVSGTTSAENGQTVTITFKDSSNATVTATATVSNGAWTLSGSEADISALTNGTITVTADVSDAAGNAATQATKTITLDNVAPSAPTLTAVADTDNSAFDQGFTVTEGSDVVVTVDGTALNSTELATKFTKSTASGLDTYTAKAAAFTGSETITVDATITDTAGNQSTAATQLTLQDVDTTAPAAPTLTAVADTDNSAFDQGFTVTEGSDVVVTVNGTALNSTELAAKFTKSTASGLDTYTAKAAAFTGSETITVDATITDTAGNQSAAATQLTLQDVDTTAPAAPTLTAVADTDNSAFDQGFTVTEGSDVVVTVNGTALNSTELAAKFTKSTASGLDTYTAKAAAFTGSETITVDATITDTAGNQSTAATQLTLQDVDTTAPAAPTLTAVADTDNSAFDQGFTVTEGSDVVVTVNGTALNSTELAAKFTKSTASGLDTYTAKAAAFTGSETITVDATITDTAGNQSTAATQLTLQDVDTTAPAAPTLTAVADTDNSAFDQGFTVTEGSDVVVTVNGTALNSTELAAKFTKSTASGLDTYTAKAAAFTGSETIKVDATITDTAGNQSTATTQLILRSVDTTAPSIASDAAVVTTTTSGGTTKTTDLKETDKVVLTIALGEAASNLSGLPTGTDSTIIKVAQTAVTANWSDSGEDLFLTYTVASGVNGTITVDETALATALDSASITDAAGNALAIPTFTVTNPTNTVDADDVFFEGLIIADGGTAIDVAFTESSIPAGTDESGDNTAKVIIDVSFANVGDVVELYIDGAAIAAFSDTLDQTEIDAGTITTGELTFTDATNQDVALEIKVKNSSGTYIQDNGDVTWEYQW